MRLLVCVKRVPAPGARINVTADGMAVDTTNLGFTVSPHEECAVEEAVQVLERRTAVGDTDEGNEVCVLTLGPSAAEEQLRTAAGVGANRVVLGPADDACEWDPQRTAVALTDAVRQLESDGGPFAVIFFGNESADGGNFQVGVRVARALGRPMVNAIKGVEVSDDGSSVTARRETDNGYEVFQLPTPCAVGVKEGINLPRYPTMKGRIAARKAQVAELAVDGPEGGQRRLGLKRPPERASDTTVLGDSAAAAGPVVDLLDELGLL